MQRIAKPSLLLWAMLLESTACRTSATVRRDAAIGVETTTDLPTAIDLPTANDLPLATTSALDAGGANGVVPHLFTFVNNSTSVAYIDLVKPPVDCLTQAASGWQACAFFSLACKALCSTTPAGSTCCQSCELPMPQVLVVPAGESRSVRWTGMLFSTRSGHCSDCDCQDSIPVVRGSFQAAIRVYRASKCEFPPCAARADGVMDNASPTGASRNQTISFSIPYPSDAVVLEITD